MTKKKISSSSPVKGAIIISLIKAFAFLPLPVNRIISRLMAAMMFYSRSTSRRVTEINLMLCFPELTVRERGDLTRKSLRASAQLMTETAGIWIRTAEHVLPWITEIEGEEIIAELSSNLEKGSLIISPHLGNWELLYTYLAKNTNTAGLYRPPKIAELEPLIIAGRKKTGGKLIKTSQMDVRKMLRALKNAENLFVLPDQQPQQGSGVLAAFYGKPAYTMTLLQGLAKRTGASIIMATCIRLNNGFKLTFRKLAMDNTLSDVAFAEQLNQQLQLEIDKTPEQYEWAYKRFKVSVEGETDPYRSD